MELSVDKSHDRITLSFILFLVWTFTLIARPQDFLTFLEPIRPILVISVMTIFVMFLETKRSSLPFFRSTEVKLIFALYAIMIAGIPFAVHRGVAFRFVISAMPNIIVYFIVCILQLRSLRKLNITAGIIMISILFSACFYMQEAIAHAGQRITAGRAYDPNDNAMIFAMCIPFCLYMLLSKNSVVMKVISVAASGLAAASIMLSGSRGGFLAFAVVAVLFILGKAPGIKAFSKAVIIILLAVVFINYFSIVEGRFQNIGSDYNISEPTGRFHIWKQNMAIIARNPVLGTGAGCSQIALGQYRASTGGTQAWQASHSSIFQMATETGIIGVIIFMAINIFAIISVRRIRKDKQHPLANFAFFVELSLYGFWVGGLLLSQAYLINLYLLLGMAFALKSLYSAGKFQEIRVTGNAR